MQRSGFTIIEIMVVIILIGIITTIGLPRFLHSRVPIAQSFMHQVNLLVTDAVAYAQKEGEPCRIFFNLGAQEVELQTAQGKRVGGSLEIPSVLQVTDVVINGESQFQAGSGKTFYFLVNPEGMSQEVHLTLEEKKGSTTRSYTFYLNPFLTSFRVA